MKLSDWLVEALSAPVRLYRWLVSPLLPPMCRYHPSCSAYALGALHVHGPLRGSALAVGRVLRCQPWGGSGFDPVPPREGTPAVELVPPSLARVLDERAAPPWIAALPTARRAP